MSKRDWYFVGGFLGVVAVIVVLFNNESEPETAPPTRTPIATPLPTSDISQEAIDEFLATPSEEGAMMFGFLEGGDLGAARTPLTRQQLQDAIVRYSEDLEVEPVDVRVSCESLFADRGGAGLETVAVELGAKRAYIAGLLLGYAGDAPAHVVEFCDNYKGVE